MSTLNELKSNIELGETIRRKIWPGYFNITKNYCEFLDQDSNEYRLDADDLLADDWEIIDVNIK